MSHVAGVNNTTSGRAMPRSNFTQQSKAAVSDPGGKWDKMPRGSRRNVREKQASSHASVSKALPYPGNVDIGRFADHVRQFSDPASTPWESFQGYSLQTMGVLLQLQNSLQQGDFSKAFNDAQEAKSAYAAACKELRGQRAKLSKPLDAAYILLKLLNAAPDSQSLCQVFQDYGLEPNDPRLKMEDTPLVSQGIEVKVSVTDPERPASPQKAAIPIDKVDNRARELVGAIALPEAAGHDKSDEKIRTKIVTRDLNICFPVGAPVVGLEFDKNDRVSKIRLRDENSLFKKTVKIQWKDGLPTFGKLNSASLRNLDPKKRQDLLDKIGNASKPRVKEARPGTVAEKAFRSFDSLLLATDVLRELDSRFIPNTYFRRDVQFMKYDLDNAEKFKASYLDGEFRGVIDGKSPAECAKYIPALIVEAAKDIQSILKGSMTHKDMLSLLALFPDSPADRRDDYSKLNEKQIKRINKRMDEVFGANKNVVYRFCDLLKNFDDVVGKHCPEIANDFPAGYWNLQASLFGFDSQELRTELIATLGDDAYKTKWANKVKTFCIHVLGDPDAFFVKPANK